MPYNPGVVDRSGELLGAGIQSMGSTFGNVLAELARKNEEEKFIGGHKKLFRPKDDAQAQQLGYNSVAAYDNADARTVLGTIEGMFKKATLDEYKAKQGLQAEQLARLAGERQAATQFNAAVAAEPPDTVPMAGDPVSNPNSSGVDILAGLAGQGGQGITGQLGDPNSSAAGIMSALARPRAEGISMGRLQQLAAEANLPIADQLSVSHAQAFRAQAAKANLPMGSPTYDQDPVTGSRYYRFGKQVLPSGVDPAMVGVPDETYLDPGTYVDRKGKPFTVYDRTNPMRDRKASVEAIVEGEKALRGLEDDIGAWQSRAARAAKDKNVTAPDPRLLQALQARKARLEGALGGGDVGASERGSVGASADAIRAAFKAGALTKEEAVRKLQGLGFK